MQYLDYASHNFSDLIYIIGSDEQSWTRAVLNVASPSHMLQRLAEGESRTIIKRKRQEAGSGQGRAKKKEKKKGKQATWPTSFSNLVIRGR